MKSSQSYHIKTIMKLPPLCLSCYADNFIMLTIHAETLQYFYYITVNIVNNNVYKEPDVIEILIMPSCFHCYMVAVILNFDPKISKPVRASTNLC